ncbi:hypothetical protein BJX63DRAFT_438102 [Aspergillus granulosus]|uniref:Uncharacterized protein n=1 Tax=Aspergillus granulosus TaxID=176169 RepID=A0ABR4GT28_9EURO
MVSSWNIWSFMSSRTSPPPLSYQLATFLAEAESQTPNASVPAYELVTAEVQPPVQTQGPKLRKRDRVRKAQSAAL